MNSSDNGGSGTIHAPPTAIVRRIDRLKLTMQWSPRCARLIRRLEGGEVLGYERDLSAAKTREEALAMWDALLDHAESDLRSRGLLDTPTSGTPAVQPPDHSDT